MPDMVIYYNGSFWQEVPFVDWSIPNEVTVAVPVSNLRNGLVEIALNTGNGDNPLPIELSSLFAINQQGEFVTINWTTASESQLIGYNVYRENLQLNLNIIEASNLPYEQTYRFIDDTLEEYGSYEYWLEVINVDNTTFMYGPASVEFNEPSITPVIEYTKLSDNYPNPFNPTTNFEFSIKENERGIFTIYNVKGQIIETNTFESGIHNYKWNAESQATGIYFYKLKTESFYKVKKMLLLK